MNCFKTFLLYFVEFCYPNCDWEKETTCPGKMDPGTGEQITADTCMPMKDANGCMNHCSMNCGEKEMLCPGKSHADGCKDGDYCYHGST